MEKSAIVRVIRPSLIAILTVITILSLVTPSALAWNHDDDRWDDPDPLYWYIESWNSTATQNAFYSATSDWDSAGTAVDFSSSASYDVYCYEWYEESEVSGLSITYKVGDEIVGAQAKLNTYNTAGFPVNKRRGTAGHELGHVIGLLHETGAVLMFPGANRYETYGIYTPQQDDIDGVDDLYS